MKKNENEKLEGEKGFAVSKGLVAVAALTVASSAFAADTDGSFTDLLKVFTDWLQGDLGRLLALLGMAGTFVAFLMTHRFSVLFIGIIISLVAGGLVSISKTMFLLGTTSFDGS